MKENLAKGIGPYPQGNLTKIRHEHARNVYVFGAAGFNPKKVLQHPAELVDGTAFQVSTNGLFLTALHVYQRHRDAFESNEKFPILRGTGPAESKIFPVELQREFPGADLALLKGHRFPRKTFIPTGDADAPPGGLIATCGYVAPFLKEAGKGVIIDQRFATAMVSGVYEQGGIRRMEFDRDLPNGASGGPVLTMEGWAIAVAVEQLRDWIVVDERTTRRAIRRHVSRVIPSLLEESESVNDKDWFQDETEDILERRELKLPIGFTFGSLLLNIADELEEEGVPIHRISAEP